MLRRALASNYLVPGNALFSGVNTSGTSSTTNANPDSATSATQNRISAKAIASDSPIYLTNLLANLRRRERTL
jgi:hypothetical protein